MSEKRRTRAALSKILLLCVVFSFALLFAHPAGTSAPLQAKVGNPPLKTYLGFDANDYPGDDALPALRRTFMFSGYWLNTPPGAKTNGWTGKRAALLKNSFGFLVLFNGRLAKELGDSVDSLDLGSSDAALATEAARREGFPTNTIIYLDIEEGGRLLPSQRAYVMGWSGRIDHNGFVSGVYCSGIKVNDGDGHYITTAEDIDLRVTVKAYFIYNDACPPSPGCAYLKNPPEPSQSGFAGARVWQFAQSPRRRNFSARCGATYSSDGNCYPPVRSAAGHILLDLDSSVSPDPSTLGTHIVH
jgi:hypothetical protein